MGQFTKSILLIIVVLSSSFIMGASSCSQSNSSFIEKWVVTDSPSYMSVGVLFNKGFTANFEANIAYKNYGWVRAFSSPSGQFNLDLQISKAGMLDPSLEVVDTLPTGMPFPAIVGRPLLAKTLSDVPGRQKVILYMDQPASVDSGKSSLLGVAIQFQGVDNTFPSGSATQNFFNQKGDRILHSFTVYGPRLNDQGEVVVPGGILVMSHVRPDMPMSNVQAKKPVVSRLWETHVSPDEERLSGLTSDEIAEKILSRAQESGLIQTN